MKLLAPARLPVDVEMLVHHGAEEIFCGITPPEWSLRFGGMHWLNRRSPAGGNLQSWEELETMIKTAHAVGARIFLTLNGVSFTREQADFQAELALRAQELAVDAFIVADVGLMLHLREAGVERPFHVSTLGSAFNTATVKFYASLGATRVVMPRQVTLAEVERLAAAVPGVELETFVLNDGCFYDEGSCNTTHAMGPFCLVPWEYEFQGPGGQALEGPLAARMEAHLEDYREQLWANNNCGSRPSSKGLPLGPCALCALPRLAKAGVASAKIAGREGGSLRKLASVQLARAVLDRVAAGMAPEQVMDEAIRLRSEPKLCASGRTCLFGDCGGAERARELLCTPRTEA